LAVVVDVDGAVEACHDLERAFATVAIVPDDHIEPAARRETVGDALDRERLMTREADRRGAVARQEL
jgi:hypothetical protein